MKHFELFCPPLSTDWVHEIRKDDVGCVGRSLKSKEKKAAVAVPLFNGLLMHLLLATISSPRSPMDLVIFESKSVTLPSNTKW